MIRNRCNIFLGWWRYPHQKRRENLCIMRFAHEAVFPPFLECITPSTQKILQWFLNSSQYGSIPLSDFPSISWPWYRLWPSPNYEWFPWSIGNGCGMPAGNAYPSRHLVPSPISGLANAPIVETKFLELAMSLLDFSPRITLGTFSILLLP